MTEGAAQCSIISIARARSQHPSIPALQQPPRDHLRLDLRCALEDVQYPGVAQHAADLVFQREALAAVDLQGVVGGGPGLAQGAAAPT